MKNFFASNNRFFFSAFFKQLKNEKKIIHEFELFFSNDVKIDFYFSYTGTLDQAKFICIIYSSYGFI